MQYDLYDQDSNLIQVTISELKEKFSMIIRSESDISFEKKDTKEVYTISWPDLIGILRELEIKVSSATSSLEDDDSEPEEGSINHHGDLNASNSVIGTNNRVRINSNKNGMSYSILGNGITVK